MSDVTQNDVTQIRCNLDEISFSDVYATPNISFGNPTLKFYRLLSVFCMSLMVVEMIIKIIMKAANLMCRVVHES